MAQAVKRCNDDAWPDGEGTFAMTDATPFGVKELVKRMDQFDWVRRHTLTRYAPPAHMLHAERHVPVTHHETSTTLLRLRDCTSA